MRDPERNLQEIRGPNGVAVRFSYDNNDRIVRAEGNKGHWTTYVYNTDGFLTDVRHSTGSARYYYYENGLLTWARDENGRLLVHNFYDSNWLVEQRFGNDQRIRYSYDLAKNRKYAEQVSITFPDNTVKTIKTSNSVSYLYKRMD